MNFNFFETILKGDGHNWAIICRNSYFVVLNQSSYGTVVVAREYQKWTLLKLKASISGNEIGSFFGIIRKLVLAKVAITSV
jgi:hypothetical protein